MTLKNALHKLRSWIRSNITRQEEKWKTISSQTQNFLKFSLLSTFMVVHKMTLSNTVGSLLI